MFRLIIGSAAIGVVVALGLSGILRLLDFEVEPAIIGAIAGICAGLFAARVKMGGERQGKGD